MDGWEGGVEFGEVDVVLIVLYCGGELYLFYVYCGVCVVYGDGVLVLVDE